MATPARCTGSYAIQVIQTCDGKKKHAYKVSGIQMRCVYSYADSLSLSGRRHMTSTHTHMSRHLPQCPALSDRYDISTGGLIEECI